MSTGSRGAAPGQTREGVDEARELSGLLIQASYRAKDDFAAILARLSLPLALGRAIVALSEPAPMRDLADQLACDRSYITGLADQLEERGLIERVPGTDRRVKLLQLTQKGRATRAQISETTGRDALVKRKLTAEQRAALRPLLEALLTDDD